MIKTMIVILAYKKINKLKYMIKKFIKIIKRIIFRI